MHTTLLWSNLSPKGRRKKNFIQWKMHFFLFFISTFMLLLLLYVKLARLLFTIAGNERTKGRDYDNINREGEKRREKRITLLIIHGELIWEYSSCCLFDKKKQQQLWRKKYVKKPAPWLFLFFILNLLLALFQFEHKYLFMACDYTRNLFCYYSTTDFCWNEIIIDVVDDVEIKECFWWFFYINNERRKEREREDKLNDEHNKDSVVKTCIVSGDRASRCKYKNAKWIT